MKKDFFRFKKMDEFTEYEWELICSRCGLCCMEKLIDSETDELYFTCVSCIYLELDSLRCSVYEKRCEQKKDCVKLSVDYLEKYINYLPTNCSYRILFLEKKLPDWHYLVSGDRTLVHKLGISAFGKAVSGKDVDEDNLEDYIIY
ncbi:MAG: YcgN family cysteine cluster protein [Desulfobacteraceae bacterium]|nr:YcgN family cysteine cluster protein [Desulfobacteraceae bacterium]MCB9495130.1 YcgN family cysteine cluster protein [Desulfobacteraceae bacterium]